MPTDVAAAPHWSTASFGDPADTSPMELSALGEHLDRCKGAGGRWSAMRCVAEALDAFLASRLVTTLAIATLLMAGGAWLF